MFAQCLPFSSTHRLINPPPLQVFCRIFVNHCRRGANGEDSLASLVERLSMDSLGSLFDAVLVVLDSLGSPPPSPCSCQICSALQLAFMSHCARPRAVLNRARLCYCCCRQCQQQCTRYQPVPYTKGCCIPFHPVCSAAVVAAMFPICGVSAVIQCVGRVLLHPSRSEQLTTPPLNMPL